MKAIRIEAWQTMASYRMPVSFIIKESYPLPPYSTVIGMIHAACGYQNYVPMQVSVQGRGHSSVSEMYTKYDFNPGISYEEGRHQLKIPCGDGYRGVTRGAGRIELIVDIELLLHVRTEDESKLDEVLNGLRYPVNYPSLGRWEDLLRLDTVEMVDVKKETLPENFILPYDAYVPIEMEKQYKNEAVWHGTVYALNKDYSIDQQTGFRRWSPRVRARCASKKSFVTEDENLLMDSKGTPVFFA